MSVDAASAPVQVWLEALPVVATGDVIADARARKRAAAAAAAARLRSQFPDLDLATLRRGEHGKPYLPAPYERYGFNPSDSGGWFLFGLIEGAQIGVDLERRQPRPKARALARRHFGAEEADWLDAQDDVDHAFLRLWTLKEAMVKAIGRGLGYGLGKPRFALGPDGRLHLVELAGSAGPASLWYGAELALGPDLVGAAVWSGAARAVRIHAGAEP